MEQLLQEIESKISTQDVATATENSAEMNRGPAQYNMIAFDQE